MKTKGGGAYEVWNYHNTVDIIANYRRTVDIFQVITNFCLRHVVQSPNTEQNVPKLPFHRSKNFKIPNTVTSYAPHNTVSPPNDIVIVKTIRQYNSNLRSEKEGNQRKKYHVCLSEYNDIKEMINKNHVVPIKAVGRWRMKGP